MRMQRRGSRCVPRASRCNGSDVGEKRERERERGKEAGEEVLKRRRAVSAVGMRFFTRLHEDGGEETVV